MHSKNRPLQAPRPAGGFTRRVPLLSESEKARPSAFATGLCRNGSIRRSATFHRKPPCMSCTATTRCICGSYFTRRGFPPCCQRAKAHAQRFCSGTLPQRLQSAAALLFQKTTPECHVQLRPDVSAAIILRAGFPLAVKEQKCMPKRFRSGALPQRHNPPRHASSENRPRIPCSAMTGCIRGSILRAGVPPYCQRTKEHA